MVDLYGLVLAGGKSERMGTDKGKIQWHGKEQRYWMADLLKKFCIDVFISCRAEQAEEIKGNNYKAIKDEFSAAGPLGAIVSAYNAVGGVAWLVVACDLPLLDADTIRNLIEHRDENVIATAYCSPADHLPEPLVAIWEPHADRLLREALKKNQFSPRQILMQQNSCCISPVNPDSLINVNYPEDAETVNV
jgi:molybdopterin-guanine dinucleotide biosynthesis protein A